MFGYPGGQGRGREVEPWYDGMHWLVLRVDMWPRQVVEPGIGDPLLVWIAPRNLFGEVIENLLHVRNHVNVNRTCRGKIKVHAKIIMLMSSDNVELFIISVNPIFDLANLI